MSASFPRLVRAALKFPASQLTDIPGTIATEFRKIQHNIRPGQRIALAVGSRGIANIALMVKNLVDLVREAGGEPFIIPSMGSHGGATAAGQREVLASYGITEETMGIPILSDMATVVVAHTPGGLPVYVDTHAARADGIILLNRIKAHTDFHGPLESGLMKMIAIGLGKRAAAELLHSYGAGGLAELMPEVARTGLAHLPILMGFAVLENAYDQTARIIGLLPGEMEEREKELLVESKAMLPALPFPVLDVLVVREMGKNLSGTGMDTNITGRVRIRGQADVPTPDIARVVALDLTEESHGNALGIGTADVVTKRLVDKMDMETTYANVITTGFLERGFIPIIQPDDAHAIQVAMKTCGRPVPPAEVRLVVIKNTLEIGEIYISEGLLAEAAGNANVEILSAPHPMVFDASGNLVLEG